MSEKVAFIQAQKANYGVGRLCDNLQISRDAYYKHTARGPSMRSREDENIKAAMCAGHKEHRGVYGVRRMCTLLNQGGVPIGMRRTSRLFIEPVWWQKGANTSIKSVKRREE